MVNEKKRFDWLVVVYFFSATAIALSKDSVNFSILLSNTSFVLDSLVTCSGVFPALANNRRQARLGVTLHASDA